MWNVDHFGKAPTLLKGHKHRLTSVAFSPDGRYLASSEEFGGAKVLLWNAQYLDAAPVVVGPVGERSLAFSPDGHWLAGTRDLSDGNSVALWNLQDSSSHATSPYPYQIGGLIDLVWLPDSQTFLVSGGDGRVRSWNLAEPQATPTILFDNNQPIFRIAVSLDGTRLAGVGDKGGDLRLWDLRQPGQTPIALKGVYPEITSVDFSPDGNLLAAGTRNPLFSQGLVLLWDLRHPEDLPTLLQGHSEAAEDVAFSPDGRLLASASQDGTIRVWNMGQP